MTNFELKMLRQLLFYTTNEAARLIGRCKQRTWQKWEVSPNYGDSLKVPIDVSEMIIGVAQWREDAILTFNEELGDSDSEIVLVGYAIVDDYLHGNLERDELYFRPHQSVIATIYAQKWPHSTIVKFDPDDYTQWLGKNAIDSEAMRDRWAAEMVHLDN